MKREEPAMSRLLAATVIAGVIVGCRMPQLAVYHPELKEPRYTRVNLRSSDGVHLRSSNVLSDHELIPSGTRAEIAHYTRDRVDIVMNTLRHTMYPAGGAFDTSEKGIQEFLEKYFVDDPEDAELEKLGPLEVVEKVRLGKVLKGMTKEQVYVALGPPQWIDENRPTVQLSKSRILESDRWVYTDTKLIDMVPKKAAYRFLDDKLEEIATR